MVTATITSDVIGGGIAVMIMFTLVSLFIAVYFTHRTDKIKEKREQIASQGLNIKMPKAPENHLIISIAWFMFLVSSWRSLYFILETGELGGTNTYYMTTLYSLILVILFIYLLIKYRDVYVDTLKECGLI